MVTFDILSLSIDLEKTLLTIEEYLSLVFSVLMILTILFEIIKYEKTKINFNLKELKAKTKWLKQALILGVIICTFWIFVIKDNIARYESELSKYYPLWIMISILVYWIVYKGIIETRILNQREYIRENTIKSISNHRNSNPTNDNLFLEIEQTLVQEKLYLNPNLNLDLIAEKFEISTGYLSKLINNNGSQSFTDFVNNLRISEAKSMLLNPEFKNYTIEAIGYESGFNSKSNFYAAFKKLTQLTPSSYRKKKS